MIVRSFLDSNIFVYADDHRFPDKQAEAVKHFEAARSSGLGVISTQVMQEYFSVVTRKVGVPGEIARRRIELMSQLEVVQLAPPLILAAIDLHRLERVSFWDALILAAARSAGCVELLTEDMQAGRSLAGVRLVNPFA